MAQLSTPILVGLFAGMGVVIVGLVGFIGFLLVRAGQEHRRKLADLEERGIAIARAHECKDESIARPRAVLRRNAILPFNAKSGWGTLPSAETIESIEQPSKPAHYAPPKPVGFVARPNRLSWPFSSRRASGNAVRMRKLRAPVLSTVIESPKPSPLVPILSGTPLGGAPPSPGKSGSRPSSDQSLLSRHPAFRNNPDDHLEHTTGSQPEALRRSLTAKHTPTTGPRVRPNRSKSDADLLTNGRDGALSQFDAKQRHVTSTSTCSQTSGNAPEAPVPPLPLEVARLKSEEKRWSHRDQSPSRTSISSVESIGSSILATRPSPIMPRSRNLRLHAVSKRDWRHATISGPRPLRDTLTLQGRGRRSESSIKSSAARVSLASPETKDMQTEKRSSGATEISSASSGKLRTAESMTVSKVSSPASTVRSYTPKRRSGTHVTIYGSPEERFKSSSSLRSGPGNSARLQRQLSQASTQASSTRSSNGNPFQFDHAPLSSGKPSALKGSPAARQGHRRQNCVRISLAPTILGPPSRSSSRSPSLPSATSEKRGSVDLVFSSTTSLPKPPSNSTFAPDPIMNGASIRGALTPSSPTVSLVPQDYGPVGAERSTNDSKRLSTGTSSVFTIPAFPNPCHDIPTASTFAPLPPKLSSTPSPTGYADDSPRPQFPPAPSSPFDVVPCNNHSSSEGTLLADEYDPERPGLVYYTPMGSPSRNFSSLFSTIPEESATGTRTRDLTHAQPEDSPPCSPKTPRPSTASQEFPQHFIQYHSIPEEPLETIDPALLSKDSFNTLNSEFRPSSSFLPPMPADSHSARDVMQPLLDAAFPFNPPVDLPSGSAYASFGKPATQSAQSSPSSIYSTFAPLPSSPSLSPPTVGGAPCSPRPRHAELPTPSLDFTCMPSFDHALGGPRPSLASPLRSSIAKLRRMNSDAENSGKDRAGRGERRYLRLGRENSIALPGDESFLDELDDMTPTEEDGDEGSTVAEEQSWRLVGNLLDWGEGATVLDLASDKELQEDTQAGAAQPDTAENSDKTDTKPSSSPLLPSRTASSPPLFSDKADNANERSSIWDDGEKFWLSTPPQLKTQQAAAHGYKPRSPSPLSTRTSINTSINRNSNTSTDTNVWKSNPRKRTFRVAKDADGDGADPNDDFSPTQVENHNQSERLFHLYASASEGDAARTFRNSNSNSNSNRNRNSSSSNRNSRHGRNSDSGIMGNGSNRHNGRQSTGRYRKRNVLGTVSTPNTVNVRIQVQPPSGESERGNARMGTPGSLYDADGFLRG